MVRRVTFNYSIIGSSPIAFSFFFHSHVKKIQKSVQFFRDLKLYKSFFEVINQFNSDYFHFCYDVYS